MERTPKATTEEQRGGPAAQRAVALGASTRFDSPSEAEPRGEMADAVMHSPTRAAQQARIQAVIGSPRMVAQARAFEGMFGPGSRLGQPPAFAESTALRTVQRLAVSNKGMADSGFSKYKGDEWIWWNRGGEPNHVSAIRTQGNVHSIHAKSEYKGAKVNRVDWNDAGEGDFAGPTETRKEAPYSWESWLPAATEAGMATIRLLNRNRKPV